MNEEEIGQQEIQPSPRKELYDVFSHPEYSVRQQKKVIEALDDIDGFDITFVISHILNIELMGHLNIVSQANEVSGITFGKGFISYIDLPDKNTYFGTLLLEEGMIKQSDLTEAISQTELQLGQYLLRKKVITEQQISEIFARQMRLRLSKLICDHSFKINFLEVAEPAFPVHISQLDYYNICHDWIAGRFGHAWLSIHFLPWENDEIVLVTGARNFDSIFQMPMLLQLPSLITDLKNKLSIKDLKEKYVENQIMFLKSIYFLSMTSLITFKSNSEKHGKKLKKLESIYLELKGKKDADLAKSLSILTKLNEADTEAVYLSFMKLIEDNASDEEVSFKNELIKIGLSSLSYKKPAAAKGIASASQITSDITARAVANVQQDLLTGKYYEAMGKLKKIYVGTETVPSTKLYLIWAKISHALAVKVRINLAACENELIQVLPEDKETAEYYYVRAMFEKLKNDEVKCLNYYNMAVKKKISFSRFPIIKKSFGYQLLALLGLKK